MAVSIGINVRCDGSIDYAGLIISGFKTMESRNSNSLRAYIGKRVAIVRTGQGKALAIGEITIGEPLTVNELDFRMMFNSHLVPENSRFDIKPGKVKFLYPLLNPTRYEQPLNVGLGIVSRKIIG